MVQIIQNKCVKCPVKIATFISHMVQIIPKMKTFEAEAEKIFISHMVQIIRVVMSSSSALSRNFISHMVQIILRLLGKRVDIR